MKMQFSLVHSYIEDICFLVVQTAGVIFDQTKVTELKCKNVVYRERVYPSQRS